MLTLQICSDSIYFKKLFYICLYPLFLMGDTDSEINFLEYGFASYLIKQSVNLG